MPYVIRDVAGSILTQAIVDQTTTPADFVMLARLAHHRHGRGLADSHRQRSEGASATVRYRRCSAHQQVSAGATVEPPVDETPVTPPVDETPVAAPSMKWWPRQLASVYWSIRNRTRLSAGGRRSCRNHPSR